MSNKDKPVIVFLQERKLNGSTDDDDFFEYVELANLKHFSGGRSEALIRFANSLQDISNFERLRLIRDISLISYANENGFLWVDWDRFFALPKKTIIKTANQATKIIAERIPIITNT